MIESCIALLMIVNGEIKEHRIQDSMSTCLKAKRIAMRSGTSRIDYQCIKSKAETEIYLGEKSGKFYDKNERLKIITNQILVPRPVRKRDLDKSFFIGKVAYDTEPETTEVIVSSYTNIKQPHLDNSKIVDTKWKEIKDVY